jgi:nucleotide-binding universal stress UspA family protein
MGHIQKILVPMDGSPPSMAALREAVALAEDLQAVIDVLHVRAPDRFEVGSTTATAQSAAEQADRTMDEAIDSAKARLGERLSRRTDFGDPIRTILDVASSGDFDLIVMGTHGRVGRLHALVGSVAEAVVRSSVCPVLTVRRPDGAQESFSERIHGRHAIGERGRSPQ